MDDFTRSLVDEARQLPIEKTKAQVGTIVAQAIFDHISLDHVLWAKVDEKDGRFWGNVGFRVPPGFPDCLGTPDRMPRDNREDALGDIRGILSMTHMAARMRMPGQKTLQPIFELDNISVEIPAEAVERFAAIGPLLADMDDDTLKDVIDHNVAEIAGDKPLDEDTWKAAPDVRKTILFGLMVMGLSRGVFRHRSAALRNEEVDEPLAPGSVTQTT